MYRLPSLLLSPHRLLSRHKFKASPVLTLQLADKTSRFCLIKACMCAFWESFFLIPIPRLFSLAFNFSQPFLLQRILVSIREDQDLPVDVQNGLIAATVVIFFGAGVSIIY